MSLLVWIGLFLPATIQAIPLDQEFALQQCMAAPSTVSAGSIFSELTVRRTVQADRPSPLIETASTDRSDEELVSSWKAGREVVANELLVIDPRVDGWQGLLSGARAMNLLLLDPSQNGVDQIREALEVYGRQDAIHVISHGSPGLVDMGSLELSMGTVSGAGLESLRSLMEKTELHLYACAAGAGREGEQLLETISELTGAIVAASTDVTGSTRNGYNWDLEAATGEVLASNPFSQEALLSFEGTLSHTRGSLFYWERIDDSTIILYGSSSTAGTHVTLGTFTSMSGNMRFNAPVEITYSANGVNNTVQTYTGTQNVTLQGRITVVNTIENYFTRTIGRIENGEFVEGVIVKYQDTDFPYTLNYTLACCRVASFSETNDGVESNEATVINPVGNSSPVSGSPAVLQVPSSYIGQTWQYQLVATDPDDDPIRFRLGDSTEFSGNWVRGDNKSAPPGLTISESGLITWEIPDNGTVAPGTNNKQQLGIIGVVVEDYDASDPNEEAISAVGLDFILRVVDNSTNQAPELKERPEETLFFPPGEEYTFTIVAEDDPTLENNSASGPPVIEQLGIIPNLSMTTEEDHDNNRTTATVVFNPSPDQENRTYTAIYQIADASGLSTILNISIQVREDQRPQIRNLVGQMIEDDPFSLSESDFTDNYTDRHGAPMELVRIDAVPANGTLTLNGTVVEAGDNILPADLDGLVYTPDAGFTGTDRVEFRVRNNEFFSPRASVQFHVYQVQDLEPGEPVGPKGVQLDGDALVIDDLNDLFEGGTGPLQFDVKLSDTALLDADLDGDELSLNGRGAGGPVAVEVTATDFLGESKTVTFDVTVVKPLAVRDDMDPITIPPGETFILKDLSNLFEGGWELVIDSAVSSDSDLVEVNHDGSELTFIPKGETGSADITVTVKDALGGEVTSTFELAIAHSVPDAPEELSVTAGDGEVTLSWVAPELPEGMDPVSGYLVEYSLDGGKTWVVAELDSVTESEAVVTGLVNNRRYQFRVAAVNANGTGEFSDLSESVTPVAPRPDNAGQFPSLGSGQTQIIVGGQEIQASVQVIEGRTLQLSTDDFALNIASSNANGEPGSIEEPDAVIRFERGGKVHVFGEGFAPGTVVSVWIFSDPVKLGEIDVENDGSFDGELDTPLDIAIGEHTLQAIGIDNSDIERTLNVGVLVDPNSSETEAALEKIAEYASSNGESEAPALEDYLEAGVSNVTSDLVAELNSEVSSLSASDVDTTEKVQELVDSIIARRQAIAKISEFAATDGTSAEPTLDDYEAAGVSGVTQENLDEMNLAVASAAEEDADSTEGIQEIVDAVLAQLAVAQFDLRQNYPNPFRSSTTFVYDLPMESDVTLRIYDALGRHVATIVDEEGVSRGTHQQQWDARHLASGVYFCRIDAKGSEGYRFVKTVSLTLIK